MINRPDGLQVATLPLGAVLEINPDRTGDAVPVLVAPADDEAEPQALDLGGDDRTTDVLGIGFSLPLVGSVGLLSDIRTSAAGPADGPVGRGADRGRRWHPGRGARRGGGGDRGVVALLGTVRESLGETYGGDQSVAYALTALACALVALLALGAGVARHLRDYRRDVASLRVLGISVGTARRAGRAELVSLTVLVLAMVVAGGWLAVTLLLGGLPLLSLPVAALPLDTAPHLCPWSSRRSCRSPRSCSSAAAPAPYGRRPPGPAWSARRRADDPPLSRCSARSSAACARAPCCLPARCSSPPSRSARPCSARSSPRASPSPTS